ncbi:hypothetical protein I4U23_002632 [Adineta vaga]|nr:hypothetical protein I4U23_002632 [Adineta vaga]
MMDSQSTQMLHELLEHGYSLRHQELVSRLVEQAETGIIEAIKDMNKDFYSTPVVYDSTTGLTEYPFMMNNEQQSLSLTSVSKTIFASRILSKCDSLLKSIETIKKLTQKSGVHSSIAMQAAGFHYINIGDTVRCVSCGLEVSDWTADMAPFTIHKQRSPTCTFVSSMMPDQKITISLPIMSTIADDQNPAKRQKKDFSQEICQPHLLTEVNLLQQIRKRTFSHWPQGASPSSAQMIDAGFFNCNVGDRVMCLYCNIICQQWTRHTDDPCEVHKTLSPKCPYVIAKEKRRQAASIRIMNDQATRDNMDGVMNNDPFRCNEIVYTAACHPAYIEIPRRHASFEKWTNENQPSVDDLVRAGFFYTGTNTVVTCFYCNGSLQNWGANDNPMIEHARWFPNCAYAKQLCGAELYKKIQESKKAQQEKAKANDSSRHNGNTTESVGRGQLGIPDESTLSRFVAARLDLPVSQKLLDRNFKMSVIKRCWEDQLRLKHDDYIDLCDLFMACLILQKQIDCIGGKKENIIVPNIAIKKLRERELAEIAAREQVVDTSLQTNTSNTTDVDMTTSSTSSTGDENIEQSTTNIQSEKCSKTQNATGAGNKQADNATPSNPCVLCLEEERRLACMPCGHLATCVPCGHSLRSCPICRTAIDAFVRIYL